MKQTKSSPKNIKKKNRSPLRSSEVPVTQAMLYGIRDELKQFIHAEVSGVRSEVRLVDSKFHGFDSKFHNIESKLHDFDSKFHNVESKLHGFDSKFHNIESKLHGFESKLHGLDSKIENLRSDFHGLKSEVHKLAVLIEEQNARNIIVLDGLTGLFGRQERIETRFDEFEKSMLDLKRPKPSV